jgi:CubicO group peptidase (beta-lactamase class C family)
MQSLELAATWPVEHASLAVISQRVGDRSTVQTSTWGEPDRVYRIASVAKPITAWATLVAVEEGLIGLDDPAGQPGCTVRHLLAHAGGYGFDGERPISPPGRRRIYSNTGIEIAAATVAEAASMPFGDYLREAVFEPLGMRSTTLRGSPAHGVRSTVHDLCRFASELIDPVLISPETAAVATTPAFPQLAGLVPGVGRFDPCPWGLGVEIKGDKHPHWMGTTNSSTAFGHFGGAGTFLWVDLGVARPSAVACVALTDRSFDEWSADALAKWPQLSDAVIAEVRAVGAMP